MLLIVEKAIQQKANKKGEQGQALNLRNRSVGD